MKQNGGKYSSELSAPKAGPSRKLSAEDWFFCRQCPKKFTSEIRLSHHITLVHEKKKPFGCNYCRASFKLKARLWHHSLKKHKDKDFLKNINTSRVKKIKENANKSIFHNVELLAISDCKSKTLGQRVATVSGR